MPALLTLLESALSPFSRAKSPGFSTYVKKGGWGVVAQALLPVPNCGGDQPSNLPPPTSRTRNTMSTKPDEFLIPQDL